jgi:hypothetical protein
VYMSVHILLFLYIFSPLISTYCLISPIITSSYCSVSVFDSCLCNGSYFLCCLFLNTHQNIIASASDIQKVLNLRKWIIPQPYA